MTIETQTLSNNRNNRTRLTKRGEAALLLIGTGLAIGGIAATVEANSTHFEGEKQTTITGDETTVTEIAHDNVEGSQNHIDETVDKIVSMNPEVFENGTAFVGSDDTGKNITVPKSVG